MPKVRHITVAVSPELYRQTRHLAAEYDTTVTAIVAYLLERLPDALKRSRYPVGGVKTAANQAITKAESITSIETHPTPTPPAPSRISRSVPAHSPATGTNQNTYEQVPPSRTAPVRQYDGSNPQIAQGLSENPEHT